MVRVAIIANAADAQGYHRVEHIYDAPAANQANFGGPWGWPEVTTHMEVPADVDTEISCAVRPENGGYGWTAAPFAFVVDPAKRDEKEARLWTALRAKRNALLGECDWTQVADAPLTAEQREAWKEYRQALRNLPGGGGVDVWGEVGWPERP